MLQRNFKLCDFPVHSVCFLQNFFFRSEQKFLSVLYHCAKFYKFSLSTFKDIFNRNINFAKFSKVTRLLNLHLREPDVLAQARAISSPGRARQETISSHLKFKVHFQKLLTLVLNVVVCLRAQSQCTNKFRHNFDFFMYCNMFQLVIQCNYVCLRHHIKINCTNLFEVAYNLNVKI